VAQPRGGGGGGGRGTPCPPTPPPSSRCRRQTIRVTNEPGEPLRDSTRRGGNCGLDEGLTTRLTQCLGDRGRWSDGNVPMNGSRPDCGPAGHWIDSVVGEQITPSRQLDRRAEWVAQPDPPLVGLFGQTLARADDIGGGGGDENREGAWLEPRAPHTPRPNMMPMRRNSCMFSKELGLNQCRRDASLYWNIPAAGDRRGGCGMASSPSPREAQGRDINLN